MNPRETNKHRESHTRLQVPQRPGVRLTKTPLPQPSSPASIPLLDEQKETFSTPLLLRPLFWFGRILKKAPKRALAVTILLLVIGYFLLPHPLKKSGTTTQTPTGSVTKLTRNETPKFDTVLPAGKSIQDYGGWTRVSPEGRAPVYAYADRLNGVPIRVSQQKLPGNVDGVDKESIDREIGKIAADFNADQKLTVSDVTAHIGTSAKGPQSVILAKNGLLVLITSDRKIDNDHWIAYISSLE